MPRSYHQSPSWSEIISRLESIDEILLFNDAKIHDFAYEGGLYDIGQIDEIVHDLNVAKYLLAILDEDINRHSKSTVKRLLHDRVALLRDFLKECEVRNNSLYDVLSLNSGFMTAERHYPAHPADFPF